MLGFLNAQEGLYAGTEGVQVLYSTSTIEAVEAELNPGPGVVNPPRCRVWYGVVSRVWVVGGGRRKKHTYHQHHHLGSEGVQVLYSASYK